MELPEDTVGCAKYQVCSKYQVPEDAEGGAKHQEAEYECADWINYAPLRLKAEIEIMLIDQAQTTPKKSDPGAPKIFSTLVPTLKTF